jgi:hypothetical protein
MDKGLELDCAEREVSEKRDRMNVRRSGIMRSVCDTIRNILMGLG